MKFDICDISNIQISILMSKSIFINYLPTVRPKLLPKLNMLIIYWILTHSIFKICLFWCQKWFLLNIYQLLGLNWFQNEKRSEFIEILLNWHFKYDDLDLNVKNDFLSNIYQLLGLNWFQNEKRSEFIEILLNWYFKYADFYFDFKNDFY